MARTALTLLLALATCLGGCAGEPTLDEAIDGLQASYDAKDFDAVVGGADALVSRCEAEGADESRAWKVERLRVESLASLGKGDDTKTHLERLSGSFASRVDAKLYNKMGTLVEQANELIQAIDVYDAGAKRFPAQATIFKQRIEELKTRAMAAGDDAALDHLKSLGYL
jgi:hypothetical protein